MPEIIAEHLKKSDVEKRQIATVGIASSMERHVLHPSRHRTHGGQLRHSRDLGGQPKHM
jgi:hypothetical protein